VLGLVPQSDYIVIHPSHMSSQLNIGIVGFGRIGQIHLRNVMSHPQVDTVSICDPKVVDLPTSIIQYRHCDSLIQSEDLDAIIIGSPTPTHYDIIKSCCTMGINIFCEKPVDLDISKVRDISAMVERSGVLLQVGFNRRFDPDFSALKSHINEGLIGDIHQVTLFSRDPGLPSMDYIATSGGMMMDMTIHDFDMSRYLTGAEVNTVYTVGQVLIEDGLKKFNDIDTATTVLACDNGAVCTIHNSRSAVYGYDQRIEVFGSKGMLSADNTYQTQLRHWDSTGSTTTPPLNFFLERDFLSHLTDRTSPSVSIEDAIRATEVAIAANQSMSEGTIVSLDHP